MGLAARFMIVGCTLAFGFGSVGCEDTEVPEEPTIPLSVTATPETPTQESLDPTPSATLAPTPTPAVSTLAPTPTPTPAVSTLAPTPTTATDADGDGVYAAEDCDDNDEAVYPGAAEVCDEKDNDCDGLVDALDEDVQDAATFYLDLDEDLHGDLETAFQACSQLEGSVSTSDDCDDTNSDVSPSAQEVCSDLGADPLDDDCDGLVDDADSSVIDQPTWYLDLDSDGYGNDQAPSLTQCASAEGYVALGGDCDDSDGAFNPDALEEDCADPNDYNCDGSVGFADTDSDGFAACEECDDTDDSINPNAVEMCDLVDNNCDGLIDDADSGITGQGVYYADTDSDGYGDDSNSESACVASDGFVEIAGDCDDSDAAINPATTWYRDRDSDGFGDVTTTQVVCEQPEGWLLGAGDCNDLDGAYNPDAIEDNCADPNDYNCDGEVAYADADGDGFAACQDCDDDNANVNSDADEVCNGIDDDCDLDIDLDDESLVDGVIYFVDADRDEAGANGSGALSCDLDGSGPPDGMVLVDGDCDDDDASILPGAAELCNEVDDDCDESIDEDATDMETYYTDGDQDGYGSGSVQTACNPPEGSASVAGDCDDGSDVTFPGADEVCDGDDNDCDDDADEGVLATWYLDRDDDGYGDNDVTAQGCQAPAPAYVANGGDCDEFDGDVNPGAELGCDGLDYNCDGLIDNDADEDGYADITCGGDDCDDSDSEIYPSVGGCALGTTCLDILESGRSIGSGDYVIDPDGDGGVDAFTAYCDMDTDEGGWTGVQSTNTPTEQTTWFTGGDTYTWMPDDFTYDLTDEQIDALRVVSTEAEQDAVFHCYHVIANYYIGGGNYDYASRWAAHDGGLDVLLTPTWTLDDCDLNDSVWRESHASFSGLDLPVFNVEVRDAGDAGEYYGIDLSTAWFR